MKYATMKNYRNRMRQILLLALLVLGSAMTTMGDTWKPAGTTSATYVLRSTDPNDNTNNNFNVYKKDGATLTPVGTNYTEIYGRVNFSPGVSITLLFENTQTIFFNGQFDFNGAGSSLTMKFGDGVSFDSIAHSSNNPTLKITGNYGYSGTQVAFYLRTAESSDLNNRKLIIEGNDPTPGTPEDYPTTYNFSNNFVIDGDGPTLTAEDDGVTMTPQVTATGGAIKNYALFRIMQGTLHLKNVTVQKFSTSYTNAGMTQVYTNNATATIDLEFNHCLFTNIGAKSTTGSPVLRMQGQGGNNENRDARLKYCKFENIFGSYSLAVGSTTNTDNANATVRTVGNNQVKLSLDGCHFTHNYGCPVRWHGCSSAEPMRVNNCLIENSFTWIERKQVFGGGGMLLKGPAEITNCTIRNNRTDGKGGGIYLSTYVDFGDGTPGLIPQHSILKLDPATVISGNVAQEDGGGVAIEAKVMRNTWGIANTYLNYTNGIIYWIADENGQIQYDENGEPIPFRTEFRQNGATITNNTANGIYGGGVYISRDPSTPFYKVNCILNYGKITGNKTGGNGQSGKGGGVAIKTYKDEEITFSFTNNNGGIETFSLPTSTEIPKVKPQDVTVVVSDPELDPDNPADEMLVNDNHSGDGGGVYVEAYPNTYTVDQYPLTDGTVSKVSTTVYATGNIHTNTATNDGGGLYVKYGNVDILGGTIGGEMQAAGNRAGHHGGGIYLEEGLITAEYAVIQNNTAAINGGGINNHQGDIRIKGSTIGGENKGNTATTGSGGGVYTNIGSIFINYWDPDGGTNYVIQDAARPSEITYNRAGQNGGGINTHKGLIFAVGKEYDSKIKISHNTAINGSGGGVFCMGEEEVSAEYIHLVNAEINNNEASTGTGATVNNVTTGCGGGIYLQYGIINLTASTVNGNTANWNGGGINNHDGNINLLGSEVSSNTAHHSGGGIYTNLGDIDIEDYAENSTNSVTLRQSKVTDNHADFNGGGIDTHYGIITINKDEDNDQIEITGNTAGVNGGGIYANQGTIKAYNALVVNNTAGNNGGGANNHSGDIIFYGGSVSNNTAENGHGGGIYTNVGDIHLLSFPSDIPIDEITAFNGVELYNNIARYNGGGINNHTGRVNIRYATLRNNTSTLGNGGGIFCEGPHSSSTGYTIRLLNSSLKENKTRGANGTEVAPTGRGGGIYLKYGSIFAQGSNIVGNSANINGGGLNNHSGNIRVYGCQLIENKAVTGNGGGIYTQVGDIITGPYGLSGRTLIQKNTAQLNGGGIDNHEGKITINGDYIGHPGNNENNTEYRELGNIAITGHGGGVFVRSGNIEMFGGAISNNQAKRVNNVGGNGGGVNIGGESGEGGQGGIFTIKKRNAKPIVDIIDVELGRDENTSGKYTATIHYHVIDNLNQEYYTNPAFGFTDDAFNAQLLWVSTNQGAAAVAPSSVIGDLPGCRRLTISNLEPGTDYTVKISVTNKQSPTGCPKTGYSDDCTFTTFSASPMVLTGAVSNIGSTSATANGKVVDNGVGPTEDDPNGIAVEARGIIYSTNAPSASHPLEVGKSGVVLVPEFPIGTDDYFTLDLTGLTASRTYYVRAYAFKDRKYGYGEVEEFKTLQTLPDMGNGTVDFAQVGVQDGKYTYSFTFTMPEGTNMGNLMDYGFILSTDDDPELKPANIVPLTGTSGRTFTGTKSGLDPNTTYYVSAFASYTTNVHEPAYLPQYALTTPRQFITPNGNLPVVRAVRISEITQNSAKITGKIVYNGGSDIKVYGICYSSSEHFPTEHNTTNCFHVEVEGTVAEGREFTLTIPNDPTQTNPDSENLNPPLEASKTYYVRAYAANVSNPQESQIAYSNDYNFTTMPLTPPHIHVNVTDIQNHVASVVCTVDWGGYAFNSAFTYGIYYRKAGIDPNTNEPYPYQQVPGSGLTAANNSEFTVNLSGLVAETQYQVYAYASNTLGTTDTHSYPVTFTTIYDPHIFNLENIVITTTDGSITISGITVTAGADYTITKYGICFSEEPNPTLESESVDHVCGHSTKEQTIDHGNTETIPSVTFATSDDYTLVPNKQYYITAYAHSEQAVYTHNTYSDQTTCITLPIVATGECQGATTTTVNLTGIIGSPDPNHYITEYGVCYSTSNADPKIGGNDVKYKSVAVTAPNPSTMRFTISLNSTNDDITTGNYYWRAYVKNTEDKYIYATTVNHEKFLCDGQITATTDPANIGNVSISNNGYFYAGDQCTLTATPNESFLNWTKAGETEPVSTNWNYTFTVNSTTAGQYVAHFNPNYQYIITANPGTGGTVTGGGSYAYGDDCTLEATPDATQGYRFVNWTRDNVEVSEETPYEFSVTESGTYTANFIQTFAITATSSNSAHGTVSGGGTFDNGTSCTLTATAAEGYQFANWTKDGNSVSTNANYTFTVSSTTAGNYVANFALVYTIAATANPSIGGTVSGAGTFASGANCTLEALPNTGYQFTKWMEGNTQVSTNPTYTIENISANHTLVAHFDNITYTITAISTSTAQGTVTVSGGTGSGNNVFHYDQLCSLTAVPENTYRFEKWVKVENETEVDSVSLSPIYSFYVHESGTYKAYFKKEYMIAATADPTDGGTITGTGLYDEGEEVTLTAARNPGYFFVKWTENGNEVSTIPTYTISDLDANHTLVANFGYVDYTITATTATGDNSQGTATVSGGNGQDHNVFNIGQTCELKATAVGGYRFLKWTKDGAEVSTEATYQFTVTPESGGDYVANFEADNSGGGGGKSTPNLPREIYPSFGINPLFMEMSPLEQALWSSVADDTIRVAPKTREGDVPLKPEADTVGCLVTYPEINFNDAMLNGGGIYVNINNAKVVFSDGEIDYNHATESGGGVFIGDEAEMTMINKCEVKHNHVDASDLAAHKGGGGIYQNGVLYVGDGTEAIHYLQVTENWAGTNGPVYDPSEPDQNNRNNVYLPTNPYPLPSTLPSTQAWTILNDANTKMKRVITLLSDISKKDPETNKYYTNIGLTVDHGFRAVIYTKLIGEEDTQQTSDVTRERWLTDLIPASGVLTNAAFFDDANKYYALHVHNTVNPDTLRRQCDYLYGCWTTEVTSNPGDDHIKLVGDVYHIKTNRGLAWFTSIVNGLNGQAPQPNAKAIVENDIDMREHLWVPIGSSLPAFYLGDGETQLKTKYGAEIVFSDGGAFVGEFNGQGHVITGLRCRYVTGIEKYGLFGTVTKKYTYNMTVYNDDQSQSLPYNTEFEGAGKVMNTFVDDHVYWAFKKDDNLDILPYRVGGIAGEAMHGASIICSESRGQIIVQASECLPENTYIGGLVGKAVGGAIPAQGTSSAIPENPVVIHSSMAMPEIVGTPYYIGGLVGYLDQKSSLYNSFANPKFPEKIKIIDTEYNVNYPMGGGKFIGGLVGENDGTVENCYTRLQGNEPKNDTPESVFGWFVGTSNNANIMYCYGAKEKMDSPGVAEGGEYIKAGTPPSGHGTYSETKRYSKKYGFKHRDHNMYDKDGTLIDTAHYKQPNQTYTKYVGNRINDTLIGGLQHALNHWVDTANKTTPTYAKWTRTMASPINDDYPIPMLTWKNADEDFNSVGSKDGIYMLYEDNVNDMWAATGKNFKACNTDGSVAAMYLYDVQPGDVPADVEITGNVNVPLHIHEDIGITQPANAKLTARAGVTIKNARKGDSDFTPNPNWHLFSSAIKDVPMGLDYHTDTNYVVNGSVVYQYHTPYSGGQYSDDIPNKAKHSHTIWSNRNYFDPPHVSWFQSDRNDTLSYNENGKKIGYFPTNTPYGTWRPGAGGHTSSAEDGFFDLYCYSEEFYHWINFKREGSINQPEGSSKWLDHWHMDADDNGDHLRLDYGYNLPTGENSYSFTLGNEPCLLTGKGYMMALSSESMMMADGQLNTGDIYAPVTLTAVGTHNPRPQYRYDEPWRTLNLVGNPYQSYLDFGKFVEDSPNKDIIYSEEGKILVGEEEVTVHTYTYYTRDDDNQVFTSHTTTQSDNPDLYATSYIHPHQGFFVKVNGSGTLQFTDNMRRAGTNTSLQSDFREEHINYPLVNLLCYDEGGDRDFTTVEVNRPTKGGGFKAPNLKSGNFLLYAHFEDTDYQIVFTPVGTNTVPVRFETEVDGVFTMKWNTLHGTFNYLHLIDNLTGVDLDLLTHDEYKFEAVQHDYVSRFKLVFRCDEEPDEPDEPDEPNESDHFAFMFGDELIVNGEGMLQMFDVQGRCLMTTRVTGGQSSVSLPKVACGVYLLRLIGNDKVKVQKMVIK